MDINNRNQYRIPYIINVHQWKAFRKKLVSFPSYRHHPVAFITCETHTHAHTHNKKFSSAWHAINN